MKLSVVDLFNGIKTNYFVPPTLDMANITTIFKKKGSKFDLENDRGIFGLSVFKKILDKIIYLEKYPLIDLNMSDSNIGARKKRNIRNHLFIIYGIINSTIRGECKELQIYDLDKAMKFQQWPFGLFLSRD